MAFTPHSLHKQMQIRTSNLRVLKSGTLHTAPHGSVVLYDKGKYLMFYIENSIFEVRYLGVKLSALYSPRGVFVVIDKQPFITTVSHPYN
jgi:hypothetical protein